MKTYFIKTFGCQMNYSDSERIAAVLENKGYKPVKGADSSAKALAKADLIVVNACSVRQTAIDRIFGLKQKFARLKAKKILTGCILKSDRIKFRKFFDEVLDIEKFLGKNYLSLKPKCINKFSAFVPIMTGCDNFCTYCVVPYTRGREVSRPVQEIIDEIKNLIKNGYKKITLIGQNVNSYLSCGKAGEYGFVDLLNKINKLPGNFKIHFLTNHPKDMSNELIDTIAKCEKVVKEIHLPIQSGDDEILKKMNRKYTVKQYLSLVNKIRKKIPNVKLSTDVIVGFPGETKKQFQNTVKIFKQVNYDIAYINKYSPRSGTAAVKFKDSISWNEKKRRWKILDDILKKKEKLIVVLGPTASGKSDLAVKLAKKFNGEIISADSRQVYKGMDIGTGKITKKEMQGIPHYLLDAANPKRRFTVAQYQRKALQTINRIYKKGKVPILCGGTGFYIQAVVEGLIIPRVKPDLRLRKNLEKETTEALFKKLKKLDPRRAKNIDSKNRRRLIRALEIVIKSGKPVPPLQFSVYGSPRGEAGGPSCPAGRQAVGRDVLIVGIKKSNQKLKVLIKKRLLHRLKKGMIAEVKKLKNPPAGGGLSWKRLDDFGLEYRYIAKYLQGKITKQEMVEKLQKEIEHYAKRQMTWFKRDKRIHWVSNYREAEKLVFEFFSFLFKFI